MYIIDKIHIKIATFSRLSGSWIYFSIAYLDQIFTDLEYKNVSHDFWTKNENFDYSAAGSGVRATGLSRSTTPLTMSIKMSNVTGN